MKINVYILAREQFMHLAYLQSKVRLLKIELTLAIKLYSKGTMVYVLFLLLGPTVFPIKSKTNQIISILHVNLIVGFESIVGINVPNL
jgi:pilus assembly protein TadC